MANTYFIFLVTIKCNVSIYFLKKAVIEIIKFLRFRISALVVVI